MKLKMLDVVALIEDLPEHGLLRGQVGTVVELLADGVYEVEFGDDQGETYASVGVPESRLLLLHYRSERLA